MWNVQSQGSSGLALMPDSYLRPLWTRGTWLWTRDV